MERKKVLIFVFCLFFILQSSSSNYVSISSLSKDLNLKVKYSLDFGYFELFNDKKKVRIFSGMPYLIYENKINYMDELIKLDKNGEILFPIAYVNLIKEYFREKPSITFEKKTNLEQKSLPSSSSKVTISSFSQSSSIKQIQPVTGEKFKPINCIIIDPGHGGKDPGGLGIGGIEEKKLVLQVSKRLYDCFRDNSSIKVFLTRRDDRYLTLKERIEMVKSILNRGYNPIFISIHGNISLKPDICGFEIYTLSEDSTDEEAMAVELKENANFDVKDIKETEELFYILKDLIIDGLIVQSESLASFISKKISSNSEIKFKAQKKANFFVLRYNLVPSVLVEIGYISNLKEAKLLNNREYQEKLVNSLKEGIMSFIDYYNKTKGFLK